MTFFKNIIKTKKSKTVIQQSNCTLCWGYQEYNGSSRVVYKDKQKDVYDHRDTYMGVQKFMKENFDGMILKRPEILD